VFLIHSSLSIHFLLVTYSLLLPIESLFLYHPRLRLCGHARLRHHAAVAAILCAGTGWRRCHRGRIDVDVCVHPTRLRSHPRRTLRPLRAQTHFAALSLRHGHFLSFAWLGEFSFPDFSCNLFGWINWLEPHARPCLRGGYHHAENRAKGLNYSQLAFGLGIMAGPILGGTLSGYGLSIPALVASFFAFANTVFGFFFLPESLPPNAVRPKPISQVFSWAGQFTSVFRQKNIQNFLVVLFLLNLAFAGLQTNFPLFSNARFGWTPAQNSYFYLYVGLCGVIVQGFYLSNCRRVLVNVTSSLRVYVYGHWLGRHGIRPCGVDDLPRCCCRCAWDGHQHSLTDCAGLLRVPDNEQGRLMGGMQTLLGADKYFWPHHCRDFVRCHRHLRAVLVGEFVFRIFALGVAILHCEEIIPKGWNDSRLI
jgi:uncharacterized membrane protein YuzA (DUF378 family)